MKVIISGGGTGGHIFPAISIANALKRKIGDVEILFVGAKGKMEMERVPAAGYKIKGLPIAGFQRRLTFKNISFFFKLMASMRMAKAIINDFKPDAVVGVGGYASGPLIRAAGKKKVPALIQEQNSYAGITNRLLAKKAAKICVAYDGMEKYFPKEKILLTGNPVRQDILNLDDKKKEASEHFKLKSEKKVVLVIGGSLGARTINQSVIAGLGRLAESDIEMIWQTGKYYFEKAKEEADKIKNEGIKVQPFIERMDLAYAAADLIISRAGAGTISELCIVGKPIILVPSPNVSEDHQTKNAMALVDKQAAIHISDDQAVEQLIPKVFDMINDENNIKKLSENISMLALPNSADDIVDELVSLMEK